MISEYQKISSSINNIYNSVLSLNSNESYKSFAKLSKESFINIKESIQQIKNSAKMDYLSHVKINGLEQDISKIQLFILEKNKEQLQNQNNLYCKEAILASLNKNVPNINTRLIQLQELIDKNNYIKEETIDKQDEDLYKMYIDKDTGEIVISDKIGKNKEELEKYEEIKNEITANKAEPSYDYLEQYLYTSSYKDLAIRLNKDLSENKQYEPLVQKTVLEKYEKFTENPSREVEEALEKD